MNVDVLWFNLNPADQSIARGYWDQGMIEGLFSNQIWRPVAGYTFTHYEGELPHDVEGAVVVIPARHHATPDHMEKINRFLATLDWALVILTGDEENDFQYEQLQHPRLIVWVMTPYAGREHSPLVRFLPNGWPPAAPAALKDAGIAAGTRPKDWFFAGQITHIRRENCVKELRLMLEKGGNGDLVETAGFTQGVDPDEYYYRLAQAKVAVCPSGPITPDTFRIYEALEAGCLPIADGRPPSDDYPNGFWQYLFGMDELPFPIVQDWGELPGVMDRALGEWPRNANRAFAWWQQYKRQMAYNLREDLVKLRGIAPGPMNPENHITVLIPTSPIHTHPSTATIEATLDSIRASEGLGDCEIIIMIDGIRPEQGHRRADYEEYIRRLLWLTNTKYHNVVPVVFDEHHHQAALTRETLKMVKTHQILFVEHDTPLVNDIQWDALSYALKYSDAANVIRFHHESHILKEHTSLMLDDAPRHLPPGVLAMRTVQWSQRPHLARTDWYREMIERSFGPKARTMIEDVVHGVLLDDWGREGIMGWERWKLWIYTPKGHTIQRSTNLDGRGHESKYDMIFDKPST